MLLGASAICLALLGADPTVAATRTWTGLGVTNNWNEAANWSGGVPGAADIASFDGTSSKNAIMNVAVNVGGVSIAGAYGGTVSQAAGIAATVGATGWTQSGGAFVGGTAAFTLSGPFALTGGAYLATTGTLSISGAFTDSSGAFGHNGGTVSLTGGAATIDVAGAETFNTLRLTAGAKTIASGDTLIVGGLLTLTDGTLVGPGTLAARGPVSQASTYDGGTASLLIDGTANQTFTGLATATVGTLPPVTINKPSGTLTLAGTIRTGGGLTYVGGTLDPGASTVVLAGGTVTGNQTLNNVEVRVATTLAPATTLTVGGSLTLTAGSVNGTGIVAAQGPISQASTSAGGTASLLIDGTANQTFTGLATVTAGTLPPVTINKPSGTLTLAGTIRTTGGWTYTGGTLDGGASLVVLAGGTVTGTQTLNNVDLRATTTIAAGTTLSAGGSLTLTAGNLNGTGSLAAQGSVTQASTAGAGTASLLINGAANQIFTGLATVTAGTLPPVTINKPSGILSLAGTIRTSVGWAHLGGALDPGASTVVLAGGTISGSHALNNVDLRVTTTVAAGTTLTVGGSLALTAGALNGTGILAAQGSLTQASTAGGGTAGLLINGPGSQTFTGLATVTAGTLPPVTINKPSGILTLSGMIRTAAGWTHIAGVVDPGASTVVFAGGTFSGSHAFNNVDLRATTTLAAGATLTAGGSLSLTAGSLNGTGTLAAQGPISQVLGYGGGTATLLINGSLDQVLSSTATALSGNLPRVVIDKPSGTLSLAGIIRNSNGWTHIAGGVDPGTSTVVFVGGNVSGNHALNNVDIRATTTLGAGTTVTVGGSLVLTAGALNGTAGTGTLAAQGPITQQPGSGGGTATILINGTADQTFTSNATPLLGNLPRIVIDKSSGILSLSGIFRTAGGWTYVGGLVDPGTSTVVFVGGTINGSHALYNVDLRATTTLAANVFLTARGSLTLTAGNLNGTAGTGTLVAEGSISQAAGYGGGTATVLINGTLDQTFTGGATALLGNLPRIVIDKSSGILSLAGTIRTAGGWTYVVGLVDPGASTVVFVGGTVTGGHALNNVDVRATTTIAAGTTLTVGGSLTLTAGAVNGTGSLAAQGSIAETATTGGGTATLLIDGGLDQTFSGTATPIAGTLPRVVIDKPSGILSLAGMIRTGGGWTLVGGIVDPGASTVVFAGGTVTSAGMAFYDVIGSGGTTTLGSSMTVGHDLTVSGGILTTSTGNHSLSVAGNVTITGTGSLRGNASALDVQGNMTGTGGFVPGTSTVTLDGSAGQLLGGPGAFTFFDLVVNDPAGVSMMASVAVTNVLTLSNGSLTVGPNTLTIRNALGGATANLSADGTSSIVVTGSGVGIAMPTSVTQLNGLTLDNVNGLALQGDLTVFGTLALTNGPVDAGAFTLTVGGSGVVARTAGHVIGWLEKHVPVGAPISITYEIGDATRYAPASLDFGTVTTAGDVRARTTPWEHLDIANSGISAAESVNRFWTVTNNGAAFDAYDATFAFVPTDIDAGADTTAFVVAKLDGATWSLPAVGLRSATSTQALGMTSFSEFAIGEPTADLAVSVGDGAATAIAGDGLTRTYVVTVANSGPSDAAAVSLTVGWPVDFSQGPIAPSQGSCAPLGAGPDVDCDLGSLGAGASATVSLDYTVPAMIESGPRTITAAVSSPTSDLDPADNSALDTTTVVEVADLVVTKDDGRASVTAGGAGASYTITITNAGPSDADAVAVDDTVPAPFIAALPSADLGGDCSASVGNVIRCSLPASLAVGATWTVGIPYSVPANAAIQTVTNNAVATSDENASGVTDTDVTNVTTSADLSVTVSDGAATVVAGDGLTRAYLVMVTNAGPSDAAAVALTATWPAGFGQGPISPSQGSCARTGTGLNVICDLGTLAVGATAVVSFAYTVPETVDAGPYLFMVAVSSPTSDVDAADNSGADSTTVVEGDTSVLPDTASGSLARFASATIGFTVVAATVIVLLGAGWLALRRRRPA